MCGCENVFDDAILSMDEEKIGLTSNSVIPPPITNNFVDSFRFAFESVQIIFNLETEYEHWYLDNNTDGSGSSDYTTSIFIASILYQKRKNSGV